MMQHNDNNNFDPMVTQDEGDDNNSDNQEDQVE